MASAQWGAQRCLKAAHIQCGCSFFFFVLREYFFAPTDGTGDKVDGAGQALRNCILDFFFCIF